MIAQATVEILLRGGVVAYPTNTLPGLATLPTDEGLDALFHIKQRSNDKPVSLGVLSLDQASTLVSVPDDVRKLEAAFPQGALTFILEAHERMDERLGGTHVAVRCLAHPQARALVRAIGPITATSANESGETPARDAQSAGESLGLTSEAIISGNCPGGTGSTIVKISANESHGLVVTVMREGVIPAHDVVEWWKNRN